MKNWFLWVVVGVLSICAGVFALVNPLAASFTVEQLVGWSFVILGVLQVISAFRADGLSSKIWAGVGGALGIVVGLVLLLNPLKGMVALTFLIALLLVGVGVAKILMSMSLRGTSFFLPVLLSGVLSLILAVMILGNFPAAAATLLGILLAVELISNGVALIFLSLRHKAFIQSMKNAQASA